MRSSTRWFTAGSFKVSKRISANCWGDESKNEVPAAAFASAINSWLRAFSDLLWSSKDDETKPIPNLSIASAIPIKGISMLRNKCTIPRRSSCGITCLDNWTQLRKHDCKHLILKSNIRNTLSKPHGRMYIPGLTVRGHGNCFWGNCWRLNLGGTFNEGNAGFEVSAISWGVNKPNSSR